MSATTPLPFAPDENRLSNGDGRKKVDVSGWTMEDGPGEFLMIDKTEIKIDPKIQRTQINNARVLRITSKFAWYKFGVLVVFRRQNGTLWCIDGQHRLLAAMKRSDVGEVPCIVFNVQNRVAEARAFLGINSDRGAVETIDKFDKMVLGADPTAKLVKGMIEGSDYKVARAGANYTVRCIAAIYRAATVDFASCKVAWDTCVEIYKGKQPLDQVFNGLFALEREMGRTEWGTLAEPVVRKSLAKIGPKKLAESVRAAKIFRSSSSARTAAEGIANAVNKGKSKSLVPSMSPDGKVEAADE